jgi:hypothetical protein
MTKAERGKSDTRKSARLRLVAKLFAVHHLSSLAGKDDPHRDSNRNDRYRDAHSNDDRYFCTS